MTCPRRWDALLLFVACAARVDASRANRPLQVARGDVWQTRSGDALSPVVERQVTAPAELAHSKPESDGKEIEAGSSQLSRSKTAPATEFSSRGKQRWADFSDDSDIEPAVTSQSSSWSISASESKPAVISQSSSWSTSASGSKGTSLSLDGIGPLRDRQVSSPVRLFPAKPPGHFDIGNQSAASETILRRTTNAAGNQARSAAPIVNSEEQGIGQAVRPASTLSMSAIMRMLLAFSEDCILSVRHTKKLGFQAPGHLRRHFETFGKVQHVLMPNPYVWQTSKPRIRPASMGFIVMANRDAVQAVLASGQHQYVDGVVVIVNEFQFHPESGVGPR